MIVQKKFFGAKQIVFCKTKMFDFCYEATPSDGTQKGSQGFLEVCEAS